MPTFKSKFGPGDTVVYKYARRVPAPFRPVEYEVHTVLFGPGGEAQYKIFPVKGYYDFTYAVEGELE